MCVSPAKDTASGLPRSSILFHLALRVSGVAVVFMPVFVPAAAACQLADLPLATGVGGFLLARSACEMLCEAMAAAWAVGRAAPVRRLALLSQGGNSARVVSAEHRDADKQGSLKNSRLQEVVLHT